jgi:N-acetylglucosamine malate deacetylase 2
MLPAWPLVLVVVAHPDDETFGLGAVLDLMVAGRCCGARPVLYRGEAFTLNQSGADLRRAREQELRQASRELGVTAVTLLDYPDGRLGSARRTSWPAGHATRVHADGLLIFDDTGITRHPDHPARETRRGSGRRCRRAARACLDPARRHRRPAEPRNGQPFAGQPPCRIDVCVRVDRARQRRAPSCTTVRIAGRSAGGGGCCRPAASTCAGSSRQPNSRRPCVQQ